jgi:hypothetical protein
MNGESPVIAEYRQRLAETLAWCQPRFDPARARDSNIWVIVSPDRVVALRMPLFDIDSKCHEPHPWAPYHLAQ